MKTSDTTVKFRMKYTGSVSARAIGDDVPAEPGESFHTKAANDGADNGVPAFETVGTVLST